MDIENLYQSPLRHCNFCGKNEREVAFLIAEDTSKPNSVNICDECVDLCNAIIADRKTAKKWRNILSRT